MEIHCLKIKQLHLNSSITEYFPYDRIYLVPRRNAKIAKKLFRYSLVVDVNKPVKDMLNKIRIERDRKISLKRNDEELAWSSTPPDNPLSFLKAGRWVMVVPTYAIKPKGQKNAQLGYVLSYAISAIHNTKMHLPSVQLQTPEKLIPLMCSICANLPTYYDNKCTPGTYNCRRTIKLNALHVTNEHKRYAEKSIEGGGTA